MLRLSGLLVLCLGFCGLAFFQQLAAAEASEKEAKTKLERVKKRIQILQNQLRSAEGKRQQQSLALQETETQIGALARRIRVTKQSLNRQQRRLAGAHDGRCDQ